MKKSASSNGAKAEFGILKNSRKRVKNDSKTSRCENLFFLNNEKLKIFFVRRISISVHVKCLQDF